MQQELKGSPHVRFLKGWTTENGKKLPIGKVTRRRRQEAKILIENNIAELYTGPFPPKKMRTNFFKSK